MTRQVSLTPEAEADAAEAHAWYAERGMGLAEGFLRSLDECLTRIGSHPEGYPVVHLSVRRVLLRRFPYCLFYLLEAERAVVIGCFHARRDPQAWRLRDGG